METYPVYCNGFVGFQHGRVGIAAAPADAWFVVHPLLLVTYPDRVRVRMPGVRRAPTDLGARCALPRYSHAYRGFLELSLSRFDHRAPVLRAPSLSLPKACRPYSLTRNDCWRDKSKNWVSSEAWKVGRKGSLPRHRRLALGASVHGMVSRLAMRKDLSARS